MIPGEAVRYWQPTTLTLAGLARGCVLLALALAAGPVQAACPSSFQDVLDGTERALVAFEEGRFDDFAGEEDGLVSDLDCLDGVLEPMEVRDIHLVNALGAWLRARDQTVVSGLSAVYALDPDFDLRIALQVTDPELVAVAQEVSEAPPTTALAVLPVVDWSTWRVDGQSGVREVPTDRPVFLQLLDSRDGSLRTWYRPEGGLPVDFEGAEAVKPVERLMTSVRGALVPEGGAVTEGLAGPDTAETGSSPHRRLLLAGVGVGVLGAAALGTGQLAYERFQDCYAARDAACGKPWYRLNRGGIIGGYSLVGVAAVLGVTGVVTWRF